MRELLKQKAYRSFLMSFLFIFVLPMLLMLYFMTSTLDVAQTEEHTANQLMLEQYKNGVDGQMYAIKRIGDTLIVDEKALLFSSSKEESDYLKSNTVYLAIRAMMQQISTMAIANENIGQAYLYFPLSNRVISNTSMNAPLFYQRRLTEVFRTYEDFIAFMTGGQDGFTRVETNGKPEIYYLRTFERNTVPAITCAITLSEDFFLSFNTLFKTKQGADFTLLSPDNKVLFTTLEDAAFFENTSQDTQKVSHNGAEYYLLQSVSSNTLCRYVVSIPENVYTQRLKTMQWLFGLLAAFILIGGVTLSFMLAKRRYAPIRQLREMMNERPLDNPSIVQDDFTYLTETVGAMRNEKLDINKRLKYTAKRMSHYELEKLLNGNFTSASAIEEQLLAIDVAFASDTFALVAVRINAVDMDDLGKDMPLCSFVVGNIYEELLSDYSPHIITMDDMTVAILSLPDADVHETIAQALLTGYETLREQFGMRVSVVLSRMVHGLNEIRVAYLEVRNELSAAQGDESLRFPWQASAHRSTISEEADVIAHRVSRLVLIGACEEMETEYARLKKASEGQPAWIVRLMLSALVRECMEGLSLRLSQEENKQLSILSQHYIESAVGLKEFTAALPVLQAMAKLSPSLSMKNKSDDVGRLAQSYIAENYASADMSIQTVADHLGLTASYCSQLYKKQTGHAMLDDINRTRIEKAKELLMQSRLGLDQIAEQVGYLNSSTFIRAFKKYEGITPGQFRQSA